MGSNPTPSACIRRRCGVRHCGIPGVGLRAQQRPLSGGTALRVKGPEGHRILTERWRSLAERACLESKRPSSDGPRVRIPPFPLSRYSLTHHSVLDTLTRDSVTYFHGWLAESGLLRLFRKQVWVKPPGVQIPHHPLDPTGQGYWSDPATEHDSRPDGRVARRWAATPHTRVRISLGTYGEVPERLNGLAWKARGVTATRVRIPLSPLTRKARHWRAFRRSTSSRWCHPRAQVETLARGSG